MKPTEGFRIRFQVSPIRQGLICSATMPKVKIQSRVVARVLSRTKFNNLKEERARIVKIYVKQEITEARFFLDIDLKPVSMSGNVMLLKQFQLKDAA